MKVITCNMNLTSKSEKSSNVINAHNTDGIEQSTDVLILFEQHKILDHKWFGDTDDSKCYI